MYIFELKIKKKCGGKLGWAGGGGEMWENNFVYTCIGVGVVNPAARKQFSCWGVIPGKSWNLWNGSGTRDNPSL